MGNLRLIADNAADRATISASSTAGTTSASFLKKDVKGLAHRSTGTSVTYTLAWAADEAVGGVALPATNLGPAATVQVRGYDSDGLRVLDTGEVMACPAPPFEMLDWTGRMGGHVWNPDPAQPVTANAFSYGRASKTALWLDQHHAVRRLEITLSDPTNPAGFVDCSRIVAGRVWSPEYNPDYGLEQSIEDMSSFTRADSGDEAAERAPAFDRIALNLGFLVDNDRARMVEIMRATLGGRRVFIDVYPDVLDSRLRQDHMIYGRQAGGGVVAAYYALHSRQLQVEGW